MSPPLPQLAGDFQGGPMWPSSVGLVLAQEHLGRGELAPPFDSEEPRSVGWQGVDSSLPPGHERPTCESLWGFDVQSKEEAAVLGTLYPSGLYGCQPVQQRRANTSERGWRGGGKTWARKLTEGKKQTIKTTKTVQLHREEGCLGLPWLRRGERREWAVQRANPSSRWAAAPCLGLLGPTKPCGPRTKQE